MTQSNRIAGIDVSKDKLDAWAAGRHVCVAYTPEALDELVDRFRDGNVEVVAMEATGGLHRKAADHFYRNGFSVYVLDPRAVYHGNQARGWKAKTDRLDAEAIASHAARYESELHLYAPPPPHIERLGRLTGRRQDVTKMIAQEKCRRKQTLTAEEDASCDRVLQALEDELETLTALINQVLRENEDLRRRARIIESMPGMGAVSAATLTADMTELGHVGHRTIAALAGVAPMTQDSGKRQGERHIRGGRKEVRKAMWMPATSAIAHNPVIKANYQRLRSKGKSHKQALVACIRKMLCILNAMLRDGVMWQPQNP